MSAGEARAAAEAGAAAESAEAETRTGGAPARSGAAAARRPGRPASDAPDRIAKAAYSVLKRDGYAGLTTAKVAAASGQNKALISYYFGSKQGLVAAVARRVSETITGEILAGLGEPRTATELVRGVVDGLWAVLDRDEGLQRVYFDLASQSVVEPRVSAIMREMKEGYRAVLRDLLRAIDDGPPARDLDAVAVFLIAGLEGLSLERLERGETRELRRARALFVASASAVVGGG
ncbi:MAG: TetR family transcriptional regulator [Solirubrobacterales bacterium]|nr:TetR family transcriptional regulator [Solirubrobacterales bacterium]